MPDIIWPPTLREYMEQLLDADRRARALEEDVFWDLPGFDAEEVYQQYAEQAWGLNNDRQAKTGDCRFCAEIVPDHAALCWVLLTNAASWLAATVWKESRA